MRWLFLIILAIGLLMFPFCGGETKEPVKKPEKVEEKKPVKKPSKEELDRKRELDKIRAIKIKELKFTPKAPNSAMDLKVEPVFAKAPEGEYKVKYQWVVNKEVIEDATDDTLPKKFIKMGDWVHVRAIVVVKEKESSMFKSRFIRIAGAHPVLKLDPLPAIEVPGTFNYTIKAMDPNSLDQFGNPTTSENKLKYELLAPDDTNMDFNTETGEISWYIDNDTIITYGESVKIEFKVTNIEGSSIKSSITLKFKALDQKREDKEKVD